MIIYPKDYIKPVETDSSLKITKAKKTKMIAKAKELLGDNPMEMKHLISILEYYYIYGRKPEIKDGIPMIVGDNLPVEEGHVSELYTSKQLKMIVEEANAEMNPEVSES